MSMECQYCKKSFSNKYLLTQHQNKAKYCLSIQGVAHKESTKYECKYCLKILCSNERLYTHFETCKEKQKKEHEEQKEKLILEYTSEITRIIQVNSEQKEYIAKLEAKLEKFEDIVLSKTDKIQEYKEDKDESIPIIPIPLKDQMSSIIIEDIKEDETVNYSMITLNNVSITSRPIDHYVNATQLCQAGGKKFSHWFSLDTTKELIKELSADAGITASGLVETNRGGNNKSDQGSWIHPDLSIQLAQWISPKFAIQVSRWVRTLFNKGSVEIDLNLLREKERDIRIKDHLIKELKSVCLSKQSRVEYPEKNVIYLLTTEDHLKRRTYIIGKAKNLTNRLGTYNKTCDHTVVYYKECKGEDDMDTAETMVLTKLRDHREKANRDRFIIPEDKEISFFIGIIDDCIRFIG